MYSSRGRKITIMPSIGKLLERILNRRLCYKNEVLEQDDDLQKGFKERSQTMDNIFVLQTLIEKQKTEKKPLYLCFVDFTKAFDYIHRLLLFKKLNQRVIKGEFLSLIVDMLCKTRCRVRWNGTLGEYINSEFGVLQGGMISPKLFTEFLQDIQHYLKNDNGVTLNKQKISYMLYADDLVLCSQTPEGLQTLLNDLGKYCSKWHLIVNRTESKIMILNKKYVGEGFTFIGERLEICETYKYLGITLKSTLKRPINASTEHLSQQAQQAIFKIQNDVKQAIGKLSPKLALNAFDSQVLPILEYDSEVWCTGTQTAELERIQLHYLKYMLWVNRQSPSLAVYAECGRFPLLVRQKTRMLNYWLKVSRCPQTSIVKDAYDTQTIMMNRGRPCWATVLNTTLEKAQLPEYINLNATLHPSTKKTTLRRKLKKNSTKKRN